MRLRPALLAAVWTLGSATIACHAPSTVGARPGEAPPAPQASSGARPFVEAGATGETPASAAPQTPQTPQEAPSPTPPPPALWAPPPDAIGPLPELLAYNVTRLNGNFAEFPPNDIDPLNFLNAIDIDLVWLDFNTKTVLDMRIPNSADIELRPFPIVDNRWVYYVTDAPTRNLLNPDLDIWRYDTKYHTVDTLRWLNNEDNQFSVVVGLEGDYIAYLEGPLLGEHKLFRQSIKTGERWGYGGYLRLPPLTNVRNLTGNLDVTKVAFAANNPHDADIYMVDFWDGVCELPPFVNTIFNETTPWMSPDGNLLAFASDRAGSNDIYLVDLRNGRLDNLPFANTAASESSPIFIGGTTIAFVSNRSGRNRLYLYDWKTEVLDTLSWVDSQLQLPLPSPSPAGTPSPSPTP